VQLLRKPATGGISTSVSSTTSTTIETGVFENVKSDKGQKMVCPG
jgi:hypothetical protein